MGEHDFCVKLVKAVEKHEHLYNYKLTDYSRKDVLDRSWEEVGQEMNENARKCKEKWRNIRTVFMRHLKSNAMSNNIRKRRYYLEDMLQFVVPYLKPSSRNSTAVLPPQSSEDQVIEDEDIDISSDTPGNADTDMINQCEEEEKPPVIHSAKKRVNLYRGAVNKKKKQELWDIDKTFINVCNRLSNREELETDSRKGFLMSILPDLRSMNDQEFRQFRRKALSVIDEIIDTRPTSSSLETDPLSSHMYSFVKLK